jgi:hypothetical protein
MWDARLGLTVPPTGRQCLGLAHCQGFFAHPAGLFYLTTCLLYDLKIMNVHVQGEHRAYPAVACKYTAAPSQIPQPRHHANVVEPASTLHFRLAT